MEKDLEFMSGTSSKILNYTNDYRAMRLLSNFTKFSRIQGSFEILDAAKFLVDQIIENSSEYLEAELIKFGGTSVPEWIGAPTGWIHRITWVKIGNVEFNSRQHPTLAVAHSPSSNGKITGEAILIKDWTNYEEYKKASGKIVIADGNSYMIYRMAAENNAIGVGLYSKNAPPNAVPYKSLFLSREEASKYTIPAVSIPNYLINNIEGKEISIYLDADVKKDPGFPFILSWIGDKNSKGPALIAHMCHPSPGANDNGSGSISVIESALTLSELISKGEIKSPEKTIRFILFPEYTGSSVIFGSKLSNLITETINLDMVGVYPDENNGPLRIVNNSASFISNSSSSLFYAFSLIARKMGFNRYKVIPYDGGSDHDVSIAYNIPSVMLNQWPDYAYHTDLDDINRVSRNMIKVSSSSASLAIFSLSSTEISNENFYNYFLNELVFNHLSNEDILSAKLAKSALASKFNLKSDPLPSDWKTDGDQIVKEKPPMIELRAIAKNNFDSAIKIAKILNKDELSTTVYLREALYLSNLPVKDILTILTAEYGRKHVDKEDLREVFSYLSDAKIIRFS
ncbi:MAG: M28 family peptidase [Caldisphaera sp.]|nr:MAG: hypothetical protein C0201_02460 [Caldisphaera sp.]PMP89653.1 MAG: hypothetical protein C0171_06790 [Caldisphaera sp.]